jgi:hypothetical protein
VLQPSARSYQQQGTAVQPDPNALNWNSLLSALIGGGFAILGVFLAASREREARQTEEKARFQRDTLIALQDAIEAHVRATEQIQFWRDRPVLMENSRRESLGTAYMTPKGDEVLPPPTLMEEFEHHAYLQEITPQWHDTRYPVERLASRVDNQAVRDDVGALVATARNAIHDPIMGRINKLNDRLNDAIGLLIRDGVVTANGFVAPDPTTRRRLI